MERHSQRWNSSKDLIDGVTQLRISRRVHHRASHLDNRVLNFLLILRIKKIEKTLVNHFSRHLSVIIRYLGLAPVSYQFRILMTISSSYMHM